MRTILLALILSLACGYVVQADDGLNARQIHLLISGCTYVTNDIQTRCITELT